MVTESIDRRKDQRSSKKKTGKRIDVALEA